MITIQLIPKPILPQYKCSRCKRDLRRVVKHFGCSCNKTHPKTYSKSGNASEQTNILYNGIIIIN